MAFAASEQVVQGSDLVGAIRQILELQRLPGHEDNEGGILPRSSGVQSRKKNQLRAHLCRTTTDEAVCEGQGVANGSSASPISPAGIQQHRFCGNGGFFSVALSNHSPCVTSCSHTQHVCHDKRFVWG